MFDYRIAYNCWINDSRIEPISDEDWPSIRIDDGTMYSLNKTMAFLKSAGYNYVDMFGLITNHNWKEDIPSTVSAERKEQVKRVIEIMHKYGLKLIYGLGVYSWGFDEIITRDERVRGTNPHVMCASSAQSEKIMQKVIDFVAGTFDIDGFHLEAADQGRCHCESCAHYENDIAYYNDINIRTAGYIRENYPDKLLLINTSGYLRWGDTFTSGQLKQIEDLGPAIDVFIDVGSHGPFVESNDRPGFIRSFKASFGTANGFWIYPPQRWARDRWLIPHFQQNYHNLKSVYEDGGRSCELYVSPISNPGAEITLLCNGLFCMNPQLSMDMILKKAVERLYSPKSDEHASLIADLFKKAENLFFDCYNPVRNRDLDESLSDGVEDLFLWSETYPERAVPGELFLEPLFGIGPGFPCYLTVHFDKEGRRKYREGMAQLIEQANEIYRINPCSRTQRLVSCIRNTISDIELAQRTMKD